MIGFFVKYSSLMRIFGPIAKQINALGADYVVFLPEKLRGHPYEASVEKVSAGHPNFLSKARDVRTFGHECNLDGISKIFTVGISFLSEDFINRVKEKEIKLFNLLYFTEALVTRRNRQILCPDRVYYPSKYIRDLTLEHFGIEPNRKRDRLFGMPFFENIEFKSNSCKLSGDKVIILVPSLKKRHQLSDAFDKKVKILSRFVSRVAKKSEIIVKTREKIYIPPPIIKLASSIILDDVSVNDMLKISRNVIMFYSNGIYEYVLGGANIINVPMVIKDKSGYFGYQKQSLFNWPTVVRHLSWAETRTFDKFKTSRFRDGEKKKWIEKFIGLKYYKNISRRIAEDILV